MKPNLYLINGPLGAGKTTILRKLIALKEFKNARIIENEFASTSIDTAQLHNHQAEVQTIAGVCICCSTGSELVDTLMDFASSDAPVIIEATGVANSLQLIEKLAASDVLSQYTVAQSLFVIDGMETDPTALAQYGDELRAADVVLVTKVDLIDDTSYAALTAALTELGANTVLRSDFGVFDQSTLTKHSNIVEYYATHDIELVSHDNNTNYTVVPLKDSHNQSTIEAVWPALARDFGLRRMKGDIHTSDGVAHLEATPNQLRVTKGDADATTQLVFIGADARKITEDVVLTYIKDAS